MTDGGLVEPVRQVEGEPGECGVGDAHGWSDWFGVEEEENGEEAA